MIVVDEKSSSKLHPEQKQKRLKAEESASTGSAVVLRAAASTVAASTASGVAKRRGDDRRRGAFRTFFEEHFVTVGLAVLVGAVLIGGGILAVNSGIKSQDRLVSAVYAHNISAAVTAQGASLPGSTEVSGKFSDFTGGTVSLKDPESGETIARVEVPADHGYMVAERSFELHGTLEDYSVDFTTSRSPSTVYHFDSETGDVTKTTESKGL